MPDIHFSNAPITEAVLDLRTKLPADSDLEVFNLYYEEVKEKFPNKETQRISQFKFDLKENNATVEQNGINGLILKSTDGSRVIQVRRDGFSFNKLKPYENWGNFRKEAETYWDLYLRIIKPLEVVRVAVRYINLIRIPAAAQNFEEYFQTAPRVASGLPQLVSELFMRLVINDRQGLNSAIVTQAIDISKLDGKTIPFIFDIDVFKEISLEPTSPKIWEILEAQRMFKNEIFIESLTDKAKALFN